MGFFDKVKEVAGNAAATVSEGAKNASDKAKEMAEKSKLNKEIKNEETKINNLYMVMGKKLFNDNQQAPEGFQDQFDGIKAAQEKIVELNDQLIAVDGFVNCTKCGAKVKPDQPFCQCCGAKVEVPVQTAPVQESIADTVYCSACGKAISKNQPFCDGCGAKMESNTQEPVPTETPAEVSTDAPVDNKAE